MRFEWVGITCGFVFLSDLLLSLCIACIAMRLVCDEKAWLRSLKRATGKSGGATNNSMAIGRRQLRYRGIALSGFGFERPREKVPTTKRYESRALCYLSPWT